PRRAVTMTAAAAVQQQAPNRSFLQTGHVDGHHRRATGHWFGWHLLGNDHAIVLAGDCQQAHQKESGQPRERFSHTQPVPVARKRGLIPALTRSRGPRYWFLIAQFQTPMW